MDNSLGSVEGPDIQTPGTKELDAHTADAQGPNAQQDLPGQPGQHPRAPQLQRLASGVVGLDSILRGGFFKGGLYLIVGEPGTGKTILANQLCFNHVANGGRAVYVTLLVETHGRMLAHLASLTFFDPAAIARSLHYVSGAVVLRENGLDELFALIGGMVREYEASMLVVEGLETAQAIAGSELAFKQFLQSLHVLVGVRACTTFLVAQSRLSDPHSSRAVAVVDGLVELSDTRIGIRRVREIEVLKFRGSDYLRDSHAFNITGAGLTVYPRTEKLVAVALPPPSLPPAPPPPYVRARARLGFGTPRLDEMMHGGPFLGSCTMLFGTPGSGKTLLGLHFLAAGAREGSVGSTLGSTSRLIRLLTKPIRLDLASAITWSGG